MDKISNQLIIVSGITPIFIITIFFTIIATAIIMLVLAYQKKQLHYIKEKEQLKINFEKEILETRIEIQEQTLQHISRELHDNLGQIASLIKLNLHTIELSNLEKSIAKIDNTKKLTRQLISDIKALSVNLNGDRLSQAGIAKALEFEIDQLSKTEQFDASFCLEAFVPEIGTEKAIVLYRMAQEVISNIVKHSNAKVVKIVLSGNDGLLRVSFSDDGIGFSDMDMNKGGAGLRNLKSRAQLINARLDIQSVPGTGSNIWIELPLENEL